MKFEEYYISDSNGNSNCVVRSLCKILNKEYDEVYNELISITKELSSESYNDTIVFEEYMKRNNIFKIDNESDSVENLKLDNGSYIVFCYDKKDFYHMIPIINNTVFDKNNACFKLYIISVYKIM